MRKHHGGNRNARRRKMKIIKTNPHIINVIRWDYKTVIIR